MYAHQNRRVHSQTCGGQDVMQSYKIELREVQKGALPVRAPTLRL